MAGVLALLAAFVFALSNVLQQRGTFEVEGGISLRRPSSVLALVTKPMWLLGFGVMALGWILQAMAFDRGRVSVVEAFMTMTLVFVLPLGAWLSDQRVTRTETAAAFVVVAGLLLFAEVGDPAEGSTDAASWKWLVAIALVAVVCAVLLHVGSDRGPSARAAVNGAVSGTTAGLMSVMAKPVLEELHDGIPAVLADPKTYMVGVLAVLGVVFQQVGLGTGNLAPTVAAGAVVSPVVTMILAAFILDERLASPLAGVVGLGMAMAAAVVITLANQGRRGPAPAGAGS